jgi:hypothetical protein
MFNAPMTLHIMKSKHYLSVVMLASGLPEALPTLLAASLNIVRC